MKIKFFIAILLVLNLIVLTSCVARGDKLAGNWQASMLGVTLSMTFNGDGTGVLQSPLGAVAVKYKILNEHQIEITDIKTNKPKTYEYQLVNEDILIFEEITYLRVS